VKYRPAFRLLAAAGIVVFVLQCSTQFAGSVTETGNVTGTVVTKSSLKVAGAKVSLFAKKSEITAPDETSKPVEETYTDDTGHFAFMVDKGNYTIVASSDSEYAFQDDITPGSAIAKGMNIVLQNPGSIKGEIINSLELRGTGSVVVHLIGTAIFRNVENDGKFLIHDVPAGRYTLVSYSTYQPEFSPNYKQVTVSPDSITDLGKYSLTYNGIPIPKNISLTFDTAHQVVAVSWNSIGEYKDFQEYAVLRGTAGLADHNLKQIGYTQDTVFYDSITFDSSKVMKYEYCVLVRNKLGDAGKYYGIFTVSVMPFTTTIPNVNSVTATVDTVKGIVSLTWDSVATVEGFGGFLLTRTIKRQPMSSEKMDLTIDTLTTTTATRYSDSLFNGRLLSFSDSSFITVSYSLCIYKKNWDLYGMPTEIKALEIGPYFQRVPVVDSVHIDYDTLRGSLNISWDSLTNFPYLDGFVVTRTLSNAGANIQKLDTFFVKGKNAFRDTIYPTVVDFSILTATTAAYSVSVKHKAWNIAGKATTQSKSIFSYKKFKPVVSAGPDQNVDISSDVILQGTVTQSTWHVKKLEWKIGDNNWTVADGGKASFKTNASYDRETIVCILRAADSVGNVGLDTMNVVKQQLVVTFASLPSKNPCFTSQGSATAIPIAVVQGPGKDRYYQIGDIDYGKYAIWSTRDFHGWTLENASTGIINSGELVTAGGFYYYMNRLYTSYKSADGISWERIIPDQPSSDYMISNYFSMDNNLCLIGGPWYSGAPDLLYASNDGITWTKTSLPFSGPPKAVAVYDNKVYFIGANNRYVSPDKGITWNEDPMWDKDYAAFPDDALTGAYNDSALVVFYNERPAGVKKMSMLRNGVWSNVSVDVLAISYVNMNPPSLGLFLNRLLFQSGDPYGTNCSIKSIKLY
jgi:hypothetical protein